MEQGKIMEADGGKSNICSQHSWRAGNNHYTIMTTMLMICRRQITYVILCQAYQPEMYGRCEISCIGGGKGLPYADDCCCSGGTILTGGVDCTDAEPGA